MAQSMLEPALVDCDVASQADTEYGYASDDSLVYIYLDRLYVLEGDLPVPVLWDHSHLPDSEPVVDNW